MRDVIVFLEINEHNTLKIIAVLDIENKSYNTFISLEYFQSLMYFNIKYIKLHCADRARFWPTICHRIALAKLARLLGTICRQITLCNAYSIFVFVAICYLIMYAKHELIIDTNGTGFVSNLWIYQLDDNLLSICLLE